MSRLTIAEATALYHVVQDTEAAYGHLYAFPNDPLALADVVDADRHLVEAAAGIEAADIGPNRAWMMEVIERARRRHPELAERLGAEARAERDEADRLRRVEAAERNRRDAERKAAKTQAKAGRSPMPALAAIVGALALLIGLAVAFGGDDDEADTATTTTAEIERITEPETTTTTRPPTTRRPPRTTARPGWKDVPDGVCRAALSFVLAGDRDSAREVADIAGESWQDVNAAVARECEG